ncbi:MAG: tRNA pseudouridine(55) synthase TruB [Sphingomonadales bacterium]|nr:tRNA pseudouridine(55) synthase TruB [Sphingomonadales bacterium]
MGRKRKGEKIDGWLIIDKPEGITSTDVVRAVKRHFKPQKVGHAGTLDPLATGVLPIGMGEATKTMPYIVDQSKDYEFSVKWGEATSTDDREGHVTATSSVMPSDEEIEAILPEFIGKITQIPPVYSAIKIAGKRAYERARAGEDVEMPSRVVNVEELKLLETVKETGVSSFFVRCGKGTYVRSLGRDMAKKLGTEGHIVSLRRTRVGPFSQTSAILLDLLNDMSHIPPACGTILPVMTALDDILALAISDDEAELIRQGQPILNTASKNGPIVLTSGEQLVAIANVADGHIHPKRVFNL